MLHWFSFIETGYSHSNCSDNLLLKYIFELFPLDCNWQLFFYSKTSQYDKKSLFNIWDECKKKIKMWMAKVYFLKEEQMI